MSRKNELPAWFYRVSALICHVDDEVLPHYFDQDISDLESEDAPESDDASECSCDGEEDHCPHKANDEDMYGDDDKESERSASGSEGDWYYELKRLREERKRELKSLREEEEEELRYQEKARQEAMESSSRKEEEVRAAYEALKKAERESETLYMGSLAGKYFRLYSVEHTEHRCPDVLLSKSIEFYHPVSDDLDQGSRHHGSNNDRRVVEGHLVLDSETRCTIPPFRSPTRPSRRKHVMKSCDGDHELVFKFISDEHLILRVSRDLVFTNHQGPVPESAPDIFEFVGILPDFEKEEEEAMREQERQESLQQKREPPSPRDTWFERTHPMGSWNEDRWMSY